jgi:hypothetical protein
VLKYLPREYQVPLYESKLGIYEHNTMWEKANDKETVESHVGQPIPKLL